MTRIFTIVMSAIILWPASAFAGWFADGQCFEIATADPRPAHDEAPASSDPASSDTTLPGGCDADDLLGLDDPSSNACFEGAEVPISTLPHFIAELQAERAATRLLGTLVDGLDENVAVAERDATLNPDVAEDEQVAPVFPRPRKRQAACSAYPEECEAIPPIPTLSLEVNAPSGERSPSDFSFPQVSDLPERTLPRDFSRVGPADGHEKRLERPPEFA